MDSLGVRLVVGPGLTFTVLVTVRPLESLYAQ